MNCIEIFLLLKKAYCHMPAIEFERLCQLHLSEFENEHEWQPDQDEVVQFLRYVASGRFATNKIAEDAQAILDKLEV